MNSNRALIAGIHHWNSPFRVGTHYITRYLLEQGFEVAHISAPLTPLHRFLPRSGDLEKRRANHAGGGEREFGGRLWHYVPSALAAPDNRPILSSSLVRKRWQMVSVPNVVRTVRSAGFSEVDILFLDTIYQPFWLTAIDYRISAYRLADNTAGFRGHNRSAQDIEKRIISRVDTVFVASGGLRKYAETNGAKAVTQLPNGVDLKRFSDPFVALNSDLEEIQGPVAIYVGAFSYWFDHSTIVQLALTCPELTILLVGPMDYGRDQYAKYENVVLLGAIPAGEIPALLSHADVGLIPFDVVSSPELLNDVNPLKLYEYMAAGLPVVSYRWKELEDLGSPAVLVDDREQFVASVLAILGRESSGEKERRFAGEHDWNQTLEPLGAWLKHHVR